MNLSAFARRMRISYRTAFAFRWFKSGKIQGCQMDTGTILIPEPSEQPPTSERSLKAAIYTRVSAAENKDTLHGQAKRLLDDCAAKGYSIAHVVKEIGSGVNEARPQLLKLLTDPTLTLIVVEHKDRLTRFGFNYCIEQVVKLQGRRIEVIHQAENGKEDWVQESVSLVTSFDCPQDVSFCARLYGQRRLKRKTEWMFAELTESSTAKASAK